MVRDRLLWTIILATAVIALLILLGQQSTTEEESTLFSTASNPDPLALECLDHSGLDRHDHVTLKIYIEGAPEPIPDAVGRNSGVCNQEGANMHAVHTHSSNGLLHIELNEAGDVPLGVFFDIWGMHFDETGILEHRVDDTHQMRMHVFASGESASEDNRVETFDEYLLLNGEIIEIYYEEL